MHDGNGKHAFRSLMGFLAAIKTPSCRHELDLKACDSLMHSPC
jgi:hypothetical protein